MEIKKTNSGHFFNVMRRVFTGQVDAVFKVYPQIILAAMPTKFVQIVPRNRLNSSDPCN